MNLTNMFGHRTIGLCQAPLTDCRTASQPRRHNWSGCLGWSRLVPGSIFIRKVFLAKAGGAEDQIRTITTGNDAYRRLIYFLMKDGRPNEENHGRQQHAVSPIGGRAPFMSLQVFDFSPVITSFRCFSSISQLQEFGFSPVAKKPWFILRDYALDKQLVLG
jgi:hypothetical protein